VATVHLWKQPEAQNDAYTLTHNDVYIIEEDSVLDNDEVTNWVAELVTTTTHGELELSTTGSFVYAPHPGFVGTDSFTYRSTDQFGRYSTIATVTFTVTNTAPWARDQVFEVDYGESLSAMPFFGGAVDDDGDELTFQLVNSPLGAQHFSLDPTGLFSYTPRADFLDDDSFTYTVTDGLLTSAPATVFLRLAQAVKPQQIQAWPDKYHLPNSGTVTIAAANGLLKNDKIPAGSGLKAVVKTNPPVGTVTIHADGSFTYTKPVGAATPREVEFEYQLQDADGAWVDRSAKVTLINALFHVSSVEYSGAGLVDLYKDGTTTGGLLPKVWKAPERPNHIAMVAGDNYNITVRFKIADKDLIPNINNLNIRGSINHFHLADIPPTTRAIVGGYLVVTWNNVVAPDARAILYNQDIKNGPVGPGQRWSIDLMGTNLEADRLDAGVSRHQIYVLPARPTGLPRLYPTVARIAASAATGTTLADDGADFILMRTIEKFQTRNLRTAEGLKLHYYATWAAAARNWRETADLLTAHKNERGIALPRDGDCEAWARLFLDVLRAQGLGTFPAANAEFAIQPKSGGFLFVKQWDTPRPDNSFEVRYSLLAGAFPVKPVTNAQGPRGYLFGNNLQYKAQDPAALKGQGQTIPMALFNSHMLVKILLDGKTRLFDPSYGVLIPETILFDDESLCIAYQQAALNFVSGLPASPTGKYFKIDVNRVLPMSPALIERFFP
jgi:hypothetical protein